MTDINDFQERLVNSESVTISDGQTVSTAADLQGTSLVALTIPAGFDGTALTVQVSSDNDTFYNYYNTSGTQVSLTVAASRAIGITPVDFAGYRFIKLVSGTSQTGDITIGLQTRPL